jgi:predicted phosphodiesterase
VRFLCLSDIHGHLDPLSAVLATAERRGYGRILVAGDICFPGPEPLSTWRRLTQLRALCVQGVGDRALAALDPTGMRPRDDHQRARLRRLIEVREELGPQLLAQLAKLPQLARQTLEGGRQLLLVHGSPVDPLEPLTHDMTEESIAAMLGDDPADVVLCGGSHQPFVRLVRRGPGPRVPPQTQVINLGSVGEAAGGREASRGRFAHASFVESSDDAIEVEQFLVPLGKAA